MTKINLFFLGSLLLFSIMTACGPMDATYKDFIKDGPVMYLTKISKDSLEVRNGWKRIQIIYPAVTDGRSSKIALVTNGTDTLKYDLDKNGKTKITLNEMREGSVIFTTWLEDDDQSNSLSTDFTGIVYGEQYKNFLLNRTILSKTMKSGDLIVKYSMLMDSTLIASRITWDSGGVETAKVFFYNKNEVDTLHNFNGNSFKMSTLYLPVKNALDSIWSEEKIILK